MRKKALGSNRSLNRMRIEFLSKSANQSFARGAVAMFAASLNPTMEEIDDLKTAVSEAVTNCMVHAYNDSGDGLVIIECELYSNSIRVIVSDQGLGIENVTKAMEPFFTTRPTDEERSGMGFTVMQSFMDTLSVESREGNGTVITMQKYFGKTNAETRLVCGGE